MTCVNLTRHWRNIKYVYSVYDDFNAVDSLLYKSESRSKKINLFYIRQTQHYITLKSVRAFFGFRYQCEHCEKMMNCIRDHRCENVCNYCRHAPLCANSRHMILCTECNRSFKGEFCFQRHKTLYLNENNEWTNICNNYSICHKCSKFINKGKQMNKAHVCSDKYCQTCCKQVPANHLCYIQKFIKSAPKRFTLIFFDLESRQERILNESSPVPEYLHEANLCIASQVFFF